MKIEPGTELDSAIAEAIGLKNTYPGGVYGADCLLITSSDWDEIRGIKHLTTEGPIACKVFAPSTDLNAAFAAADKVGLFKGWSLMKGDSDWFMGGKTASTPALAICAAILKLTREQDEE